MDKQQMYSTGAEARSLSQQNSIDNAPEEQQSGDSKPADYSAQTPPSRKQERARSNRTRLTKGYKPVPTGYLTAQYQGCVEQPRRSQDHVRNGAAVVMTKSAVTTVPCVPYNNRSEALNLHQQNSIGKTPPKPKSIDHEEPPAYTETHDYSYIATRNPYQATAACYPMLPTRYHQPVPTSYTSEGQVHEAEPSDASNSAAAITIPPVAIAVGNIPYVNDHMGLSILSFLCCCWLFGIFAIKKSFETRNRNIAGDYEGAVKSSKEAMGRALAGIIIGILIIFFIALTKFAEFST